MLCVKLAPEQQRLDDAIGFLRDHAEVRIADFQFLFLHLLFALTSDPLDHIHSRNITLCMNSPLAQCGITYAIENAISMFPLTTVILQQETRVYFLLFFYY